MNIIANWWWLWLILLLVAFAGALLCEAKRKVRMQNAPHGLSAGARQFGFTAIGVASAVLLILAITVHIIRVAK